VLIYKAIETVSFVQGDLMMVGAFIGLDCMTFFGFPFWLAVAASSRWYSRRGSLPSTGCRSSPSS
jgi:branched-subunit amino acid ABC-type transport system permease component